MSLIKIGVSGLNAYRHALSVTGHNVANAGTPGYSRQEVAVGASIPQFKGFGYIGSGVQVEGVRRLYDQFLVDQTRADSSVYQEFASYRSSIEQLNRLVADERTGLGPAMDQFFKSLENAADNPSSIPVREVVIGDAKNLVDRFNVIHGRLDEQNNTLNGQLTSAVEQVNALAVAIAQVNDAIVSFAGDSVKAPPNDLLDRRDDLVNQLAELVDVSVTNVDGAYDVFIGSGQALVQRTVPNQLQVMDGLYDPSRKEIRFVSDTENLVLTRQLSKGGKIAGMLNYRTETLDKAYNQLGRIAMGFIDNFNRVHGQGLDIKGNWGENFFGALNTEQNRFARIEPAQTNAPPNDRRVAMTISDVSQLPAEEFVLNFPGPRPFNWEIRSSSTGEVLKEGAISQNFPETIEFSGMEIELLSGSFSAGDRFLLIPHRHAAKDIKLAITQPADLALALPIRAQTAFGNSGTGQISQGRVLDFNSPILQGDKQLSPPLIVVFNSPTSYSVFDNSDPLHPKSLDPPLENLPYAPGVDNELFSSTPGETLVRGFRGQVPFSPFKQLANQAEVTPGNGFNPQLLNFVSRDEQGQVIQRQQLRTEANESAFSMASRLSGLEGVQARAFTRVELSEFSNGRPPYSPPNSHQIWLNGVELTQDLVDVESPLWDNEVLRAVPPEINADFLANRINNNKDFQSAGIRASSDGHTLTIVDETGRDVALEMRGDRAAPGFAGVGDGFKVSNAESYTMPLLQGDLKGQLSAFRGFDFETEGPFIWEFALPDGSQGQVVMNQKFETGPEWRQAMEEQVNKQLNGPGSAKVSIGPMGEISFKLYTQMSGWSTNDSEKLTIGGQLDITMEPGVEMSVQPPYGNVFPGQPEQKSSFLGLQFNMNGRPDSGDRFTIEWNTDTTGDNRNAFFMSALQTEKLLSSRDGGLSFNDAYGAMVQAVGTRTRQVQLGAESSFSVLQQSLNQRDAVSGVNMDEEAARLIEFQNAYNANAQVIRTAREVFDTLLQAFR